ncbi:9345_t:CDS:2, partial [Funneliformis geosporum]
DCDFDGSISDINDNNEKAQSKNPNQLIIEDEEFEQEFQLNTMNNSFFDIIICNVQGKHSINRLFVMQKMEETHTILDQYTQKEYQKFNNKTTNNQKNFVVKTDDGSIELAAALRYEQMHANDKPIRTKRCVSQWTTACKKVFKIIKLNPQSSKFKAGNYFFFVDKTPSIFIAEIIAIFVIKIWYKLCKAKMLDEMDTSQIHVRLFDLASNSDCEFTLVMENNRIQFVCEAYLFRFFATLGDIKSYFYNTSK